MTEENIEQVAKWLDEFFDHSKNQQDFENKTDKLAEAKQVCAVMFLYKKLKPENRKCNFFFHVEDGILLIGNDLTIFEDFTEEDAKEAVMYGIGIGEERQSFSILASMLK